MSHVAPRFCGAPAPTFPLLLGVTVAKVASMSASTSDWEPPLPEDLQRMLPQYEITGILGRGGMGAVYKGRQAKLDRVVAIKLLPETFSKGEDDLNFAARFLQEARAMARLDHPGIISVYDFGETSEGQLYFVMEFIDGMDIHQYLKSHGGKLPQESAASIVAHVLDALDYAHSQGIVHRDIKPANIMLNRAGRVKVADFGLAKHFGDGVDPAAPALTMSNVAVGTPDFVAPEALDSEATPDHRADLYAVGVMLYQLLTGRLPRGLFQMPSEMRPELDPRLDEIVGRAMEANPDYRYASAAAVRADLDRVLSQPMARVEAGEDSEAVPMAVPVTETVKAGGNPPVATWRGNPASTKPARPDPAPAKGGNTGLIVGLSVAAALAAGLGLFWLLGPKFGDAGKGASPTANPSSVAKNDTTPPGTTSQTPAPPAPPAGTAGVSPAPEPPKPTPTPPPTTPPVTGAKSDPPATPVQTPAPTAMPSPIAASVSVSEGTPASLPTLPPATPATPPSPSPAPDPTVARLAALPGLKTTLDGYLAARTKQIGELAAKYRGGLQTRLDQAANAGDLKLATAFQAETARVEALQKAIATPPADALTAATDTASIALPALPEGSPEPLVALRQTWTTESDKIRTTLDAALRQSLQALEAELTKAREFENAQAVVAYREALSPSNTSVVPQPSSARPPTPIPITSTPSPTKAGPKDLTLSLATKEKPYENSLGMKFVPVKDTDVLFCIHEVRWKDYKAYATDTPGVANGWQIQNHAGVALTDRPEDHPVVNVIWEDAQAFCAWLSKKEGKIFRLPTDREWSIAVGIGREEKWKDDTTPATVFQPQDAFPWGDRWPPPKGVGNFSDESRNAKAPSDLYPYLAGYDDGFPTTAPVMSFEPNKLGLFDLGGNVWEWCEDWYDDSKTSHVLRGGSWYNGDRIGLLSSTRHRSGAGFRAYANGFRVVVELAAPPTNPTPAPTAPAPPSVTRPAPLPDPALARATKDAPYANTLGMKFVPVKDTDVLFCIHETRYKDYAAYAKDTPGVDKAWENQTHDGFTINERPEDHPVVHVSWDDAQAFCAWLSKKEGKTFRLPTDREWSVAVGIDREEKWKDDTTPATVFKPQDAFPWGNRWPPPKGAGNFADESRRAKAPGNNARWIEGYDDGFPTTAPVMSFDANKLGLFDLGGNVWEWCEDWIDNAKTGRVLRGGAWGNNDHGGLLSSYRSPRTPEYRSLNHGFRVVVEIASRPTIATPAPAASPPPSATRPSSPPDPALARATKDAPFANTLGMKFVPVPGTDVLFGIHETRYRDYAAYAAAVPGIDATWKDQSADGFTPTDRPEDHPVWKVSWDDAQKFCAWLSQKEGKTYRLPTDQEWSVAVGIGREEDWRRDTTPATVNKPNDAFPWGKDWPLPKGAGNYGDQSRKAKAPGVLTEYIDGYDDGFPTTAPVMSFAPNKLGIFDLGGNVFEWCEDWYDDAKALRVTRGASWNYFARGNLLSSFRHTGKADVRHSLHGFRVVVEVSDAPAR
jgi:formylglycine-generating enzyme required for sulfatase activity/serine/threonine protein kinase